MAFQPVKFYQTGTFTVGNRLLAPEQRSVQASAERSNALDSGHRACQGCGEALGARYAVDAAMRATAGQLIAAALSFALALFLALAQAFLPALVALPRLGLPAGLLLARDTNDTSQQHLPRRQVFGELAAGQKKCGSIAQRP